MQAEAEESQELFEISLLTRVPAWNGTHLIRFYDGRFVWQIGGIITTGRIVRRVIPSGTPAPRGRFRMFRTIILGKREKSEIITFSQAGR